MITRDSVVYDAVSTYGIVLSGGRERVRNNIVICPTSTQFIGIRIDGKNALIEQNQVMAHNIIRNGYTSATRSMGIGFGNRSGGGLARGNETLGFDVGVGPAGPYHSWIKYSAVAHESLRDALPIDPAGLVDP